MCSLCAFQDLSPQDGSRARATHGGAHRPFLRGVRLGVVAIGAAYATTVGDPAAKSVLLCLADRACDECGLAWPGVPYLAERTELGLNRIRAALAKLVEGGFLLVHAYPHGGRGLSTEYVVLPALAKLSTAPCGKCQSNRKTHRPGGGYSRRRGALPTGFDPETHLPGGDHPSVIQIHQADSRPQSESAAPTEGASEHEPGREIPTASQDALRSLGLFAPPPPQPSEGETPPESNLGSGASD